MKQVRVFLSVTAFVLAFGAVSAFRTMPVDPPGYEFVDKTGVINDECVLKRTCHTDGTIPCRVTALSPILKNSQTPSCGSDLSMRDE